MANFLLSYQNWIDQPGASLSASHEVTTLPVANLANPDVLKIWRAVGSTAPWLQVDFGVARAVRVLGLFGVPRLASSDTVRWRLGSTAGAGDVYDSGVIACGRFDGYAQLVHCLAAPLTARYCRVDLSAPSQSALGYVDAGRLWAGAAWQGARNYSYGFAVDIDDGKTVQVDADRAPASAVYVDPRTPGRTASFALDALTPDERWIVADVKRLAGKRRQVLFVPDPDSADLQREALLGLIENSDPIRHVNFPTRAAAFALRGALLEE